ncbi:MAG: F0F1 ATP synthase subunit B [Verrucomicrobiales bacterium]
MFNQLYLAAVETAHTSEVIEKAEAGFFESFGVNWPFFIAQLLNFIIVIFVLKKFAFGPIQEILEKRRARIAEGEEKLKEIEQRLAESEKETEAKIAEANKEAQRLIDEAKESSTAFTERKSQEAVEQAQGILAKAEAQAKAEREQLAAELKRDFGRLVTATTAKVSGKVLNDDDQRRINEEALQSVQN